MYQNFIIPYLYEVQHVSGDTPPTIRSLKLHWQPLVFHTGKVVWRAVGGCCQAQSAWQRPPIARPTTFPVWKTRGCQCSFRLLMMGGVSPETFWASYIYIYIYICIYIYVYIYIYIYIYIWNNKILIHFCILLEFFYELYYDARIHEIQVYFIKLFY